MEKAIAAATEYYQLTGKPLGITGEVGEYLVAKIMGLELMPPRTEGFDAIAPDGSKIEIKARSLDLSKSLSGQRLSRINLNYEWDRLMMILMDQSYKPHSIYEADRADIEKALLKPGSKARNERGALAVTSVIGMSRQIWKAAP